MKIGDLANLQTQIEENGVKMGHMEDNIGRIVKLLQHQDGKIPKEEELDQGTHEEKNSAQVEIPSMNKHDIRGIDSNMGSNQGWFPRGLQLPKIDMRKFDGKDPITWIFQMEQFFDIHQVPNLQKVTIASLYLEPQQFVWYQWLCECKKNTIISWSIFIKRIHSIS